MYASLFFETVFIMLKRKKFRMGPSKVSILLAGFAR
jgi:hypothetical protein